MRRPLLFPPDEPGRGYCCDRCGQNFHTEEHGDVYRALEAFNAHACEANPSTQDARIA